MLQKIMIFIAFVTSLSSFVALFFPKLVTNYELYQIDHRFISIKRITEPAVKFISCRLCAYNLQLFYSFIEYVEVFFHNGEVGCSGFNVF